MTYKEVILYFGSPSVVARKCGFSVSTPYIWKYRGFVPFAAQHKIEKLTGGDLKADYEHVGGCK